MCLFLLTWYVVGRKDFWFLVKGIKYQTYHTYTWFLHLITLPKWGIILWVFLWISILQWLKNVTSSIHKLKYVASFFFLMITVRGTAHNYTIQKDWRKSSHFTSGSLWRFLSFHTWESFTGDSFKLCSKRRWLLEQCFPRGSNPNPFSM